MKRKKTLIMLLVILFALGVVIAGLIVLKSHYSPMKSLERMFSLRADMELEEYYKTFDLSGVDKNVFTSLNTFVDMAEEKGWDKITSFEIEEKDSLTYIVKYNDTSEEITLIPQKEKALIFFDTYKIDVTSLLSRVMYVSVHIGAELYIDGELMERSYISNPEEDVEYYDESYDNYIFFNVFDKEYDIKVLTEYTKPYNTTVRPNEIPYVLRDVELSDAAEGAIYDTAHNFIQRFYYAMQDGEDFSAVTQYITENEENRSELQLMYEDLYNLFTRGKNIDGLVDICFLEDITTVSYPNEYALHQNIYPATTTVRYSFNYLQYDAYLDKYTLHSDIFDETTFTIHCVMENGKWVVSRVDDILLNLNY